MAGFLSGKRASRQKAAFREGIFGRKHIRLASFAELLRAKKGFTNNEGFSRVSLAEKKIRHLSVSFPKKRRAEALRESCFRPVAISAQAAANLGAGAGAGPAGPK
ncbi:hypothetical protein [Kozakia baliensis]|uniref:hypothetical protein n=1 Tax=Kozakia baliensis TaxID=153496 RepID=UPI001246E37D|nr:hypothetical protein [Kozakia baliensis]